uniref:Uncharacterized protein n=1 Tax=Lepeophtheirus salmonis TaxID=72036 RepID=A0A0K2V021_LEPSM
MIMSHSRLDSTKTVPQFCATRVH